MEFVNIINNITDIIKNISKCKILEIGCANGKLALFLAPFCIKYDAIDINNKSILNAINNTPTIYKNLHFYNYSLENNNLINKYNLIILCRTFHFGNNHKKKLQTIKKLLNKNGIIIIIDIIIIESTKFADDSLNKSSSQFNQDEYDKKKQEVDASREFLLKQKNMTHFIKDNLDYFIINVSK